MGPSYDGDEDLPRTWRFVPSSFPRDRDERALASARRADALRSAIGLVDRMELCWETGPAGGLLLSVIDADAIGWATRCLLSSYPSLTWRPVLGPRRDGAAPAWTRFGVPLRPASSSFPADPGRPWCDAVAPALGVLPAGLRLRWTLRPGAALLPPRGARPTYELQPPGVRLQPLTEPEREARNRQDRRRREPPWEARVVLEGSEGPRCRAGGERLAQLVEAASGRGGENRLKFVPPLPVVRRHPPSWLLSEGEVAALLPGPDTRIAPVTDPEPGGADPGLALGRSDAGLVVRIAVPPAEGRHLAIVGETGMGKSSALLRLARGAVRRGGVVLLDPIGDTGRALFARLPASDLDRAVWISPTESPVAVDLIASLRRERVGDVAADRALNDVVDALRRVRQSRFSETPFWGPRIEETVRRALAAAASLPGGTLRDAERLLAAVGQRPAGVPPEAREAVEELWHRARERPEEVDGSRRLIAELTGRPALARMLASARPRFSPSELSHPGRIVVVTAEAPQIGEAAARYLLAVYLALFWSARLSLANPPKTFLLLEEAQWYAHESVSEMLRLGRRTNVHVYLATQALSSLPEGVAEAIRTNAADYLVFRGAPDDAREFSRWTPEVDPVRLLALPRGQALLLRGKGALVSPVHLDPGPPGGTPLERRALETVRSVSRSRWPDDDSEPPEGVAGPTGGAAGAPDRFRDLWLVLWAAVLEHGDAPGPVRVPLRRLRAAGDPGGSRVREAGRWLRHAGALVRADRDIDGSWWDVERSVLADLLAPGVGAEELAEATRRWRAGGAGEGSGRTQPS